jgi:hypothetical protein
MSDEIENAEAALSNAVLKKLKGEIASYEGATMPKWITLPGGSVDQKVVELIVSTAVYEILEIEDIDKPPRVAVVTWDDGGKPRVRIHEADPKPDFPEEVGGKSDWQDPINRPSSESHIRFALDQNIIRAVENLKAIRLRRS